MQELRAQFDGRLIAPSDPAAAVVAHTRVHVRVQHAAEDDVARGPQTVADDPCACEESARRNFTRRELAAALRQARANHRSASSEQRDENEPTADASRIG
jgi:hypothetical protein